MNCYLNICTLRQSPNIINRISEADNARLKKQGDNIAKKSLRELVLLCIYVTIYKDV